MCAVCPPQQHTGAAPAVVKFLGDDLTDAQRKAIDKVRTCMVLMCVDVHLCVVHAYTVMMCVLHSAALGGQQVRQSRPARSRRGAAQWRQARRRKVEVHVSSVGVGGRMYTVHCVLVCAVHCALTTSTVAS
jgi:hypothetical protein